MEDAETAKKNSARNARSSRSRRYALTSFRSSHAGFTTSSPENTSDERGSGGPSATPGGSRAVYELPVSTEDEVAVFTTETVLDV